MLDWFSGLVGYSGEQLFQNRVLEVAPSGEIVWQTERKIQARGSFESSIQIGRACPTDGMAAAAKLLGLECQPVCLELSGNPSKFLQGHNVFGPSVQSLADVLQATVAGLPEGLRPGDVCVDRYPALHRSRVDITTSVRLPSHEDVHAWLRTVANSRTRHGRANQVTAQQHGHSFKSGDTVYWGQHSRRWSLKAYCKHCELLAHPVEDAMLQAYLLVWTRGMLRLELCLRTPELKNRGTLTEGLIWEYMQRVQVGGMKKVESPGKLSRPAENTFIKWQTGIEVRFSLPQNTFYRHRREILEKTGLDIGLNPEDPEQKKVDSKLVDIGYLAGHEIKLPPEALQGYLFMPKREPKIWPAHASEVVEDSQRSTEAMINSGAEAPEVTGAGSGAV